MNPLSEIIRREITQRGVLPFARFMELALYCPVHGYYETKKDNPGRHGDFYTSVGVGDLFGRLLAFQFAEWLEPLRIADCRLRIVEAGAHAGQLARDILNWLQMNRPELLDQIEYWIIEPSARRQEWQKKTLEQFSSHVRWFTDFQFITTNNSKSAIRSPQLDGVVFSNELLDAMPVHRFGWDVAKKTWFEWGVTVDGKKFVWERIQNSESRIQNLDLPVKLLDVLPDGYTVDICPAAENWWREAANILEQGRLMTIDYGLTVEELFLPNRMRGTLRAYFRQHTNDDILGNIGEQDLTAHINFPAIQAAGESVGLRTEIFSTQSQFLTQILEKASKGNSLGKWTPAQTRQFQSLTHPEHLGRAFRVLVQTR